MAKGLIKKGCDRCNLISTVAPRERRCKRISVGAWSKERRYCWGNLRAVAPAKPTYQEDAARKAREAQKRFDELVGEIRRASALLGKWQQRAAYYSKRAQMTEEQLLDEREERKAREAERKGQRRALDLRGAER